MIGSPELLAIGIAALILFGPNKLPQLAKSLGQSIGDFKKAQRAAELEITDFDAYAKKGMESKEDKSIEIDARIKKMADDVGIDTVGKSTNELIGMLADIIKTNAIKP